MFIIIIVNKSNFHVHHFIHCPGLCWRANGRHGLLARAQRFRKLILKITVVDRRASSMIFFTLEGEESM